MNKKTTIILVAVILIGFAIGLINGFISEDENNITSSKLSVNSASDLIEVITQIYEGVTIEMPSLQTVEMTDEEMMKIYTGLEDVSNIEYIAVSEPMMSSQAYSLVLAKAKDGADVNSIAKTMNENIDTRKWICVTAEKVYTAASGDVICLVMTNGETAKAVFESFKNVAGAVGEVYERTSEKPEMPEDMLPGSSVEMPEDMPTDNQPAAMEE